MKINEAKAFKYLATYLLPSLPCHFLVTPWLTIALPVASYCGFNNETSTCSLLWLFLFSLVVPWDGVKVLQNFHYMVISTSWICKIPIILHWMICFSFSFRISGYFNGFQL